MTYGPMFNHNHIPVDILRRFTRLHRIEKGVYGALRGVVDTGPELNTILERLKGQQKRCAIVSQGQWTGVYCV